MRKVPFLLWPLLGGLPVGFSLQPAYGAQAACYLAVSAGDYDRRDTLVQVSLPNGWRHFTHLQAPGEPLAPLQVESDGQTWFIVPKLAKGETKLFGLKVVGSPTALTNRVEVKRQNAELVLTIAGGGQVLAYRAAKLAPPRADIKPIFTRAAYLHPIFSPSGRRITDDYPANHLHHHGLWFAWPKTQFEGREPNFWEMGAGTGTVEAKEVAEPVSGPVWGGFLAYHQFVDLSAPTPKLALAETWEVRLYNVGTGARPYYLFDVVSTQTCAGLSPLKILQYHYGGMGLRGNWLWNGKDKAFFLTSEGETDRVKANQTRARWCYIGGAVDGQQTGLAVLGHPDNHNAPQPLRLHPEEPYFGFSPSQLGEFSIVPGRPYVSRYRAVVFDGAPDRLELDRLWNDYAHPPKANVVMPAE
jgi:hypothetical protein